MENKNKYSFWLWLCRFAYKKINQKDVKFNGLGVPGLRDKENPCEVYAPSPGNSHIGECESDGHYLCKECRHFNHVEQ